MKTLDSPQDIKTLVDAFYTKVLTDPLIGEFFTTIAPLDWEKHIPQMYAFWEMQLLGKHNYKGNPMLKHLVLHQKKALQAQHFKRWLMLWKETITTHFHGDTAEMALQKATQISQMIQHKLP